MNSLRPTLVFSAAVLAAVSLSRSMTPPVRGNGAAGKPARDDAAAEKLGWRLSLQAYTFRGVSFFETIDIAAKLGIKYLEMYPGQVLEPGSQVKTGPGMDDATVARVHKKLADHGMKLVAFGVSGVGTDEATARKAFEFAKKMGIEVLVTETSPTAVHDKLCAEFGIKMALHNHPNSWPPEKVLEATKERSKMIGACADTGHWVRAGKVPTEALKMLEGRIASLHFKDLSEKKSDVPWGTGKGDAKGQLAELSRQGFKGVISIEYETGQGQELIDNVAKCIAFFDATAAELLKAKAP